MFDLIRLDFHDVLRIVARFCSSECTRSRILRILPGRDLDGIQRSFGYYAELSRAVDEGFVPKIPSIHDCDPALDRASIENSALSPEELLGLRENIRSMTSLGRDARAWRDVMPGLSRFVQSVAVPDDVKDAIDAVLDEGGAVREDASPALREISDRLRSLRTAVEEVLEGYFRSRDMKRFFQERQITMKEDRYVVPLKQNFKGRLPGIVHAHSGSDRTVFIEPYSIVEKNNEIKMLRGQREEEIHRLLVGVTGVVRRRVDNLRSLQEVLILFEMLWAKLRFAQDYGGCIPSFSSSRDISIRGGIHPLIRGEAVPVDFTLRRPHCGLVVTGPNTGGKTVCLKMIGLFALLAQSAIPVPARSAELPLFSSVFADIGDEGSIQQSLSTFSAHVKNIREILGRADEDSLVLLDELGAGTDPIEGGPLGVAILEELLSRGITTIVTTHFSFIKLHAVENESIEVASMEFDPETCSPTYRLVMGIPGRSNALEISRHLGLGEGILERTESLVGGEERSIDSIFKKLASLERELSIRENRIMAGESDLNAMLQQYKSRLEEVREKEGYLKSEFRREMTSLLADYRKSLEASIRRIREDQASRRSINEARKKTLEVEEMIRDTLSEGGDAGGPPEGGEAAGIRKRAGGAPLRRGDLVEVTSGDGTGLRGRVIDVEDGDLVIQAGSFRIRASGDGVKLLERGGKKGRGEPSWDYTPAVEGERYELDIRGKRLDDAMTELIGFLDRAVLSNLDTVYIIHGLGTGALRRGVWKTLRDFPHAERYAYAHPDQGGYGCTVVTLKGSKN